MADLLLAGTVPQLLPVVVPISSDNLSQLKESPSGIFQKDPLPPRQQEVTQDREEVREDTQASRVVTKAKVVLLHPEDTVEEDLPLLGVLPVVNWDVLSQPNL